MSRAVNLIVAALFALAALAPVAAMGADAVPTEMDPVAAARLVKLSEKLRCLVCQNQTIADSNAELAKDLRQQIREQIAAGKTDDEIATYMVNRYGDFVLYQPPVKPTTYLLWIGPALLAAGRLFRPHPQSAPAARRGAVAHRRRTRAGRAPPRRRQREIRKVIAFVSIAAVMLVAALAWVLVPLLRGPRTGGVAREASNVAILRDQLAELDNDVANGVVRREQYDQAKRELEQRVLEESKSSAGGARSGVPSSAGAWTAAILGGALPIAAALLYFTLGSHDAFAPAATSRRGARRTGSTTCRRRRSRKWRPIWRPSSRRSRTTRKAG